MLEFLKRKMICIKGEGDRKSNRGETTKNKNYFRTELFMFRKLFVGHHKNRATKTNIFLS